MYAEIPHIHIYATETICIICTYMPQYASISSLYWQKYIICKMTYAYKICYICHAYAPICYVLNMHIQVYADMSIFYMRIYHDAFICIICTGPSRNPPWQCHHFICITSKWYMHWQDHDAIYALYTQHMHSHFADDSCKVLQWLSDWLRLGTGFELY